MTVYPSMNDQPVVGFGDFQWCVIRARGREGRAMHPSDMGVYIPAGKGGPDFEVDEQTYVMISYHFMTPIDANNTRYHWLQHRNTDPYNEELTASIASNARAAFLEDRDVLEAVHTGIANETTRHLNLGLDAASLQFRRKLDDLIFRESETLP